VSQYTNQDLIGGLISPQNLISLTDDEQSGLLNMAVLNQVIQSVSGQIDGILAAIYQTPFNQVNPPPLVQQAATFMACFALMRRRLVPGEKNPFEDDNALFTKRLNDVANGKGGLDANTLRAFPPGVAQVYCSPLACSSSL